MIHEGRIVALADVTVESERGILADIENDGGVRVQSNQFCQSS